MTDERYEFIKNYLQQMEPFQCIEDIHNIPIMRNNEDYKEFVVKNFIRCGALPKSKLEIGKTYIGSCRNAIEAKWTGVEFEYMRTKFGCTYPERINHFEDDNGFDLFVPLKIKE